MITAIVHTYNAEKHLAKVLDALQGFDEVLVIDNESTDSTRLIAEARPFVKFITRPSGGQHFVEAHRQFGINQASNPWILEVDADEIVPAALRDYLYQHIQEHPEPHALLIPIKNYFMGQWMRCYYPDYILRLIPKEGTVWPQHIHSRPQHQGPLLQIPRRRSDLAFIHLANETVSQTFAKMNNYTDIEVERRSKGYSRWQIFLTPPFRFFKTYILKGGWREGMPGFIHAVHDAIYRFAIMAKIEEKRRAAKGGCDIRL